MFQCFGKTSSLLLMRKSLFQSYASNGKIASRRPLSSGKDHDKSPEQQSSRIQSDSAPVSDSNEKKIFKFTNTEHISKTIDNFVKQNWRNFHSNIGTLKNQSKLLMDNKVQKISELKSLKHYNVKSVSAAANTVQNSLQDYLNNIYKYVADVTHMNQVQQARERVLRLHKEIVSTATIKRDLVLELDRIRKELNEFYTDMDKSFTRSPEKFVELAQQKAKLCTKEKELSIVFNDVDTKERILHNEFIFAINDSFEKEKQHTSYLRVLGIFGTLLSSILTLIFYIRRDHHQRIELREIEDLLNEIKDQHKIKPTESWGSYINRHTRWLYSWAYKS